MILFSLVLLAQDLQAVEGIRESSTELRIGSITVEIRNDSSPCYPGDRRKFEIRYHNDGSEGAWVGESRACQCSGQGESNGALWLAAGGRLDRSLAVIADPRVPRIELEIAIKTAAGRVSRASHAVPMEVLTPYAASFSSMRTIQEGTERTAIVFDVAAADAPLNGVTVPFYSNLITGTSILDQCSDAVSIAYWMPPIAVDAIGPESTALLRLITPTRGGAALFPDAPPEGHDHLVAAESGVGVIRWNIPFDPQCDSCRLLDIGYVAPVPLEVKIKSKHEGKQVISLLRNSRAIEPIHIWLLPVVSCKDERHDGGLLKALLLPASSKGS